MIVYLDVCCLGRPFDDQSQTRIRLEAEAICLVLELIDSGKLQAVSSEMSDIELEAVADPEKLRRIRELLPAADDIIGLSPVLFRRAAELGKLGFKPADALHVAAAERARADFLLTCDDRLCRVGRRHKSQLRTAVMNVLDFVREYLDASNA